VHAAALTHLHPPSALALSRSYEICTTQTVGLADSYLALPGVHKSPSGADALVIRIELPGTASVGELALEVTPSQLALTSPLYRLEITLPARVAPGGAAGAPARWDANRAQLSVTLPLA
jgi:hypothetical protein